MTFLLGLSGPDFVGKTSTSNAIRRLDGRWWLRSWAAPLRERAAFFLGVDPGWFSYDKNRILTIVDAPIPEMIGRHKRWFLQQFGTGFGRSVLGQTVWINMATRDMGDFTVFDDCRFPEEAARCNVVIELSRVGVDYPRNHESSHPLPDDCIDWRLELTPGKPEIDAERILNYLRREHGI